MNKIAPYAKTWVAIAGTVLTAVLTQFPDNPTVQQWGPIISALLTAVSVYVVPNRDPQATHQDESVQPPEAGAVDLVTAFYVLGIVCFVVATLWLLGVGTRGLFG